MSTRVYTLQDLDSQVFVPKEEHEDTVNKLKNAALTIKEELLKAKRKNVQDDILIKKLTAALKDIHSQLKVYKGSQIKVASGGSSSGTFFGDLNKQLITELNITADEIAQMEKNADNILSEILEK